MEQSSQNAFFDELKEWSERKLTLLEKYLESATKILGSIDQVYYVDGFAGRGSYGKPGETQMPGSPLLAAQLAHKCSQGAKAYSLQCINVEIGPYIFEELEAVTAPFSSYVTNIKGAFAQNVDCILRQVGSRPVVCFLDPFGVDGIDWTAVQKLIHRRGITDFWIRFDAGEVRRRDGYYNSSQPGADKQFDILCRVYGINDKDRLHSLLDGPTPEARMQNAKELYLQLLRKEFTRARGEGYAEAYRIGSLEEETKYYLVFATAGKKGIVLASDLVYGVEEGYQRELERYKEQTTYQMNMFALIDPTPDKIFQSKVDDLQQVIWDQCRGQAFARLDIHTKVLDDWFGIIKRPHITSALKGLKKSGHIVSVTGPISDDRTVFVFRKA